MQHNTRIFLGCLFYYMPSIIICQIVFPNTESPLSCSPPVSEDDIPSDQNVSMKDKVGHAYLAARKNLAKQRACEPPPIKLPENRYIVDAFYVERRFQESSARTNKLIESQQLFEEVTKILRKKYNIGPKDLPSQEFLLTTVMADSVKDCQRLFIISNCDSTEKYRTIDGSCNNLENPTWGMTSTGFTRLLPPVYDDDIYKLRKAASGKDLPNPRKLSVTLHNDEYVTDETTTVMFMQFGQFIAHDVSGSPFKTKRYIPVDCCHRVSYNPECVPLKIDNDDPFYPVNNVHCLNGLRTATFPTCNLGAREQTNQETVFIDGSIIYGISKEETDSLRNKDGTGTLKSTFYEMSGELPSRSQQPSYDACSFQANTSRQTCFQIGDTRGNMHPALTALQIIFVKQHNRLARLFHGKYSNWDEEKIFQESRRVVIAQLQMITYNEYLPLVLGPNRAKNLMVQEDLSFTQYDSGVNPSISTEFSTAAFRFAHSMINGAEPTDTPTQNLLRDFYSFPFDFYRGFLDSMISVMLRKPARKFDRYVTADVTNFLYRIRGQNHGLDLITLDIFRGRERGLPTYVQMQEFCGGPKIKAFSDLDQVFREGYATLFEKAYESVEDIDLFDGGLAEEPANGAIVGLTFAYVMEREFLHLKFGDRFYFEHENQVGSFTPAQLEEIKKTSFAKIICENTGIRQLQKSVFLNPNSDRTKYSCEELPDLNPDVWAT